MSLHHPRMSHVFAPFDLTRPMLAQVPPQFLFRFAIYVAALAPQVPVHLQQFRDDVLVETTVVVMTSPRRTSESWLLVTGLPLAGTSLLVVLMSLADHQPGWDGRSTRSVHRRRLLFPRQQHSGRGGKMRIPQFGETVDGFFGGLAEAGRRQPERIGMFGFGHPERTHTRVTTIRNCG